MDISVMPYRNGVPLDYWANQMDLVTLSRKFTKLPVDWELDDASHFMRGRQRKDVARDNRLMSAERWWVTKPKSFTPGKLDVDTHTPWVIVRIPYAVINRMVRTAPSKKYAMFSIKEGNETLIREFDDTISSALAAEQPKRILWKGYYDDEE